MRLCSVVKSADISDDIYVTLKVFNYSDYDEADRTLLQNSANYLTTQTMMKQIERSSKTPTII